MIPEKDAMVGEANKNAETIPRINIKRLDFR